MTIKDRILGLDYGEKTIGVAVSDPFLLFAQGLEIIRRTDEKSLKQSMKRLSEIISEYGTKAAVLGFPKNMNNTLGPRCDAVLDFKQRLENSYKIEVVLWDERLSTVAAARSLSTLSRDKKKAVIDKMAAVYILQGYLDSLSRNRQPVQE